jgi:2-polyprenyl-6-hydroxyphenyl methylase/3-demethylubiquinone-9 3-methyltransferase
VAFRLAEVARRVIGIDTAHDSVDLARQLAAPDSRCEFVEMDATKLAFGHGGFDKVVCVQNGICAFGVDQHMLLREALRVTRPGGEILVSSYSEKFWEHRLQWFEAQAGAGLVGPIDYTKTGNGTIVCQDGFHAGKLSSDAFRKLAARLDMQYEISEVDESSVFCTLVSPRPA